MVNIIIDYNLYFSTKKPLIASKKSKVIAPSSSDDPVLVKAEQDEIQIEDSTPVDDEYQDFGSGDMDATFDDGSFQDVSGGADSFTAENKGKFFFSTSYFGAFRLNIIKH